MNKINRKALGAIIVAAVALTGCRGSISGEPPVHVVGNMDFQERFEAQEANPFFADMRAMRRPVEGTIARGFLKEDIAFYTGRHPNTTFVTTSPLTLSMDVMRRGQDRFEVFCAVCHGSAGDGLGIIMTGNYGMVSAPTYHSDNLRAQSDGYLFEVISNGVRTMPSYARQIPVRDRWAIVAYIRALQRSQYATEADLPATE